MNRGGIIIIGIVLAVVLLFTVHGLTLAALSPTAQDERSREILREDKELRARIEEGEKVFIEKIVVKGVSSFSKKELDEVIRPFEKQWLSQKDIENLEDAARQLYLGKGYTKTPPVISSQISQNILEITIEEQ